MIPTRSGLYPLLRNRGRVDDGEALQTDVMRFMAILGLCLTAVFALVHSLPSEPEEETQENVASPAEAQQALLSAEHALEQAQQRLAAVELQLETRDRQRDDAERQLQTLDTRLQQRSQALLALQAEGSTQEKALQALNQELLQLRAANQRLASDQAQRAEALQSLGQQLEQARKESKQRRLAAADSPHGERRTQSASAAPVAASDDPQRVVLPERKNTDGAAGFLLRFASVEALDGLVRRGAVGFSGVVKRQAWKLALHGEKALFVAHAAPQKMHEMAPQTVPSRYLRAFREVAGDEAFAGVVWGVTLPLGMERKIRALTEQARSGVLVIYANGEVRLTRGGRA